jgi:hypothetical protein
MEEERVERQSARLGLLLAISRAWDVTKPPEGPSAFLQSYAPCFGGDLDLAAIGRTAKQRTGARSSHGANQGCRSRERGSATSSGGLPCNDRRYDRRRESGRLSGSVVRKLGRALVHSAGRWGPGTGSIPFKCHQTVNLLN